MILRYFSQFDGQPLLANVAANRLRIGRSPDNDVILGSPYIDDKSVEMRRIGANWMVHVFGANGCTINGEHHHRGSVVPWIGTTRLEVFPFVFQFQEELSATTSTTKRWISEINDLIRKIHVDLLQQMHHSQSAVEVPKDLEALLSVERSIESSAKHHGLLDSENAELLLEMAGNCIQDELLNLLLIPNQSDDKQYWKQDSSWSRIATLLPVQEEELQRWTVLCARRLFGNTQDSRVEKRIAQVDKLFWDMWHQLHGKLIRTFSIYLAMRYLKKQIKDILFGFGPLEDLLRIPTVSEIMVNSSQEIYIEQADQLQNSGRKFVSDEVTMTIIERIVGAVGRRIDTAQPMVDARLPDGSRVNAVIPPLAVKGPCLTIRKFSKKQFTMQKLVQHGSITPQVVAFLEGCVRAKKSILVSGGTGTGKTTLLNCLSQAIPTKERIICVEDTHELQLNHPHVVFMECRDGNNEGKGKISIRDLVRNALRQRPDRIIIGECRSDEALDMLQAMNTGHSGSMTTVHANTPADALRRIEVLVRDSGLPPDAIRQQIVSAIDVVVQITRLAGGHRMITAVSEVIQFVETSQTIQLRPIFTSRYDDEEKMIQLGPTGCLPSFATELIRDSHIRLDLFLEGIAASQGVSTE